MMPLVGALAEAPKAMPSDPSAVDQAVTEASTAKNFVALLMALVGAAVAPPEAGGPGVVEGEGAAAPPADQGAGGAGEEQEPADPTSAALMLGAFGVFPPVAPTTQPLQPVTDSEPSLAKASAPTAPRVPVRAGESAWPSWNHHRSLQSNAGAPISTGAAAVTVPVIQTQVSDVRGAITGMSVTRQTAAPDPSAGQAGMLLGEGPVDLADTPAGGGSEAAGSGQQATGSRQQATGSRQQATGSGELAAGNWQRAAGSGQGDAGSGQRAAGRGELAAGSGQRAAGRGELAAGSGQRAGGRGQGDAGDGPQAGGSDANPNDGIESILKVVQVQPPPTSAAAPMPPAGQASAPSGEGDAIHAGTPLLSVSASLVEGMSQKAAAEPPVTPGVRASGGDAPTALPVAETATDARPEGWTAPRERSVSQGVQATQAVLPSRAKPDREDGEEIRPSQEPPVRTQGRRAESPDPVGPAMEAARSQVFELDEGPRPVLSAAGMERVARTVRTAVSQGRMEMRLRLQPESLGDVQVQIRWEGGVLTARLEAATPTARDALEGGLHLLRNALQEQGVPVERLQVGLRLDLGGQAQGHTLSRQAEGRPEGPPTPMRGVTESVTTTVPPAGRLDVRV